MPLQVLSIQSDVVAGHVGNDAAAFTLQRLGIEAWPIHTVQASNHTGHGAWTGQAFAASHVRELVFVAEPDAERHGRLNRRPLPRTLFAASRHRFCVVASDVVAVRTGEWHGCRDAS